MKHLKKFSTDTDRIAYEISNDYIEPYVSLVGQNSSVHYNRMPPNYLRFTALEDGSTLQLKKINATNSEELTPTVDIKYSWDGFNFITYDYSELEFSEGQTIYLCGNNPDGFSSEEHENVMYHCFIIPEGSFECHGNVMSLLYGLDFETSPNVLVIPNTYCFHYLFYDDANEVGCNITTAPELPATTLTNDCYYGMFYDCTSLTTVPELPATILAEDCYYGMFYNCTNLVTAPKLPATTLAQSCYYEMFYGCTNLTKVPKLPATTLASGCYHGMFASCISLTTAPELPAITLAQECYAYMFAGCISLVNAPELPATELEISCYNNMFYGCTSLIKAPKLSAIVLADSCYSGMFSGCTSLTTAPVLPATILTNYCYSYIFQGCTSLNSITCLATDISATNCTKFWVSNVASIGTFIKYPSMSNWTTGVNSIPEGWTTTDAVSENYLTFNILSDGIIKWKTNSSSTTVKTISYSINDGEWISITSSTTGASFNVSTGDKVRFKGNNNGYATSNNYYNNFDGSTASFDLEGNIMSLVDEVLFDYITTLNTDYTFSHLFYRTNVIRANNLVLPAITLSKYCYANMFGYCSLLTVAPILPATTLANYCYNCMFYNCTSLTTTPVLPATTLAESCYSWMFYNCTSLTSVPELPATVLVKSCYEGMFYGCTSLKYIKAMFTTTPSGDKPNRYTANWVYNVASIGIFIKSPAATWDVTGVHGIPTGWTVKTATE